MGKNLPANAGDIRDAGSIPGSGRSPGGGHGSLFQYSCLENPMDTGAWWATVHRVAMSQTQLKQSKQARITWRFYLSEDANLVGLAGLLGDAVATGPSTYHSTPD